VAVVVVVAAAGNGTLSAPLRSANLSSLRRQESQNAPSV